MISFNDGMKYLSHRLLSLFICSGYTGVYANGDGDKGVAECPFQFYNTWVTDPLAAQRMAEKVTRSTIGVKCCPVPGIPSPDEVEEIQELTDELNLT
jgi:amidase